MAVQLYSLDHLGDFTANPGGPELVQLSAQPRGRDRYPSLFSPDTDEEFSDDGKSDFEEPSHAPLLHIKDVVKAPLQSLSEALEILVPRLKPNPDVKGVSVEDQENFGNILLGELASRFSVLRHQIDDPFLDTRQNRRLHREISVEVCSIVEQLFGVFIYRAAKVSLSPLSTSSSMTKLKAQLMVEANKRLNIPVIRRAVLKRLRGPIVSGPVIQRICSPYPRLPPIPKQPALKTRWSRHTATMELEQLELGAPLEAKKSRFGVKWEDADLRRRIIKLRSRLPTMPVAVTSDSDSDVEAASLKEVRDSTSTKKSSMISTDDAMYENRRYSKLRRIASNPELYGDFLLCDLGYFKRQKRPESAREKEEGMGLHRPPSVGEFLDLKLSEENQEEGKAAKVLGEYLPHDLNEDLRSLEQQRSVSRQSFTEDDLHPLLQAHVHGLSHKQVARLAAYDASMKKEEKLSTERESSSRVSSVLEQSIPSVATMDQLPYLNIEHAPGGSGSSNLSLHVKSGLPSKKELVDTSQVTFVSSNARRFGSASTGGYLDHASGQLTSRTNMDSQYYAGSQLMDGSMTIQGTELEGQDGSILESHLSPRMASSRASDIQASLQELTPPMMVESEVMGEEEGWAEEGSGLGSHMMGSGLQEEGEEEGAEYRADDDDEIPPVEAEPQTAVVTVQCPGQGIVRTSDVRVSERTPLTQIRQKPFGPIYNELAEDWDSSTTEELDSIMYEGKEITALYKEITKTLPTAHLKFDTEPTLEPCLDAPVKMAKILASRTLNHRRTQRIINPTLRRNIPPPWGVDGDKEVREVWEQSTEYKGADLELHQRPGVQYPSEISHQYNTWLSKWKATVDPEDFFKFTSRMESDYLRLVYHLYDSEGSDSEEEDEHREKRARLAALQAKQRQREVRKKQRYKAKSLFEQGMWNVNTVMMGGLGRDPESGSSSEEEEEKENLKKLHEKATNLETIQKNLKQIWTRLMVPSSQQIDMAIKYSGGITQTRLNKVLNLWENAADLIERREIALSRLESFERMASDPGRFFAKGNVGSASVRLNEARERDRLHKALDRLDRKVSALLQQLYRECGDVVTYKGRPYAEKMRLDRTEMLYWLQQARRQVILKPTIKSLTLDEVFISASTSQVSNSGH